MRLALALAVVVLPLAMPSPAARAATGPVDVLLMFDCTYSMDDALDEARAEIADARTRIRQQIPDARFGVAAVRDHAVYGSFSTEPWTLVQPITADDRLVDQAIASLVTVPAGDSPEAYANGLAQADLSPTVGWRPGARRVLVLVADDLPHDNDVEEGIDPSLWFDDPPVSTGVDPGPDGLLGTPDDVDWQATLRQLAHDGLPLMFVFYHGVPEYLPYWQAWASSTGGVAEEAGAGDLGDKLVALAQLGASAELQPCPDGESRDASGRCAPVASVDELAMRYRPWLQFDSDEHWRPLEVGAFLSEPGMRACRRRRVLRDKCVDISTLAGLRGTIDGDSLDSDAAYLDVPAPGGRHISPYCSGGVLYDCDAGVLSTIYYHAWQRGSLLMLDYWWYLRFNDMIFDGHEGDWEGVTVFVKRKPTSDTLLDVAYAAHSKVWRYPALSLSTVDRRRPRVYVAQGSHAAYPRPCPGHGCVQSNDNLNESSSYSPGVSWEPEGRSDGRAAWGNDLDAACVPAKCLQALPVASGLSDAPPLRAADWAAWPGTWGRPPRTPLKGKPEGPGVQRRFRNPADTSASPRTGSAATRARAAGLATCDESWFGPFVQAVTCDPAARRQALSDDALDPPAQLALRAPGQVGVGAGVAQALGDPLASGQQLTLSGSASATTTLLVRTVGGDGVVRALRIGALGLQHGGTTTVTVRKGANGPDVVVRTPRHKRTLRPPTPRPPSVLGLQARHSGRAVRVTFAAIRGALARVELVHGRGGRALAARSARVHSGAHALTVIVPFAPGSRFARVTLSQHGRTSRAALVRLAPAQRHR